MPLSEHEQRQFEQIERALRASDPRFAEAVRAAGPRVHYKRRTIGAAPVLQWTTRRASPALILELGRDEAAVRAVAVLPDGQVVTRGGSGARVLVWDPAAPAGQDGVRRMAAVRLRIRREASRPGEASQGCRWVWHGPGTVLARDRLEPSLPGSRSCQTVWHGFHPSPAGH